MLCLTIPAVKSDHVQAAPSCDFYYATSNFLILLRRAIRRNTILNQSAMLRLILDTHGLPKLD